MPKSTYAVNRTLEYLLRSGNVYVALFTTLPDRNNTGGVEVSTSGTAYSRKQATFSAAANSQAVNSGDIVWSQATANWGSVVAFGVYDAVTGGNQLYADALPGGAVEISASGAYGDQFMVPAGTLAISES